jgi:hypothetical protein
MKLFWAVAVMAAAAGAADMPTIETTLNDQAAVSVTAYNNNIALVRDVRRLQLPSGELHLRFSDVAQQIRPETVSLVSPGASGAVAILEQNYEFDLMTPNKLLEKYVGKQVKLRNFDEKIGLTEVDVELVSVNERPIYRVNGQIVLDHPGTVVLPQMPENLVAKPSLVWVVNSSGEAKELEATYLTGGITWSADYVATLAKDEESLDLSGWVTMHNQSGATYANAVLKLVAGEVNVVQRDIDINGDGVVQMDSLGYIGNRLGLPKEESFAEYHLYTMPRKTTIKNNETKQLALLAAGGVPCTRKYEFRGSEQYYSAPLPEPMSERVGVFVEFENKEAAKLGMPLPAGVVRVYQEDTEGAMQFAGEDSIKHTPKDEKVTLKLGNAFDVVGERTQTEFKTIFPSVNEISYEIKLRNHKEKDVTVDVVEPMPENWRITQKSMDFEKKDARTLIFHAAAPKNGETVITYTVQVSSLPVVMQKALGVPTR